MYRPEESWREIQNPYRVYLQTYYYLPNSIIKICHKLDYKFQDIFQIR
jgi:hypothetical protein